jgi:hypothetical protein
MIVHPPHWHPIPESPPPIPRHRHHSVPRPASAVPGPSPESKVPRLPICSSAVNAKAPACTGALQSERRGDLEAQRILMKPAPRFRLPRTGA